MTQREQKLLWILLTLGGAAVACAVVYAAVLAPYWSYQRELAELQEECEGNELLIAQRLKDKRQMERWRMLSLPGPAAKSPKDKDSGKADNYAKAELTYGSFLHDLLDECFGKNVSNYLPPSQTRSQSQSANSKKPPPHVVLPFTFTAKGTLAALIKFLEKMDRAPFVHRVKSLTLSTKEGKNPKDLETLTINMIIEAVIVARSEKHVNLRGKMAALDLLAGLQRGPVGLASVAWAVSPVGPVATPAKSSARHYADILKRNFFVGGQKEEPPKEIKKPVEKPKEKPKVDPPDLRKEYKLVQINHTNAPNAKVKANEAYIWSEKWKDPEGYKKLLENDKFTYLKGKDGKVLRIGHREVYFQDMTTEEVFVIGMGEVMADAILRPLSEKDRKLLGFSAKKESAKRN